MSAALSVVIPNYNGVPLFPHTLPTVFAALQKSGLPYEVIVADDCSTDNSIAYLQQHYPSIRIVSNKQNSGFSVTANLGIRSAVHPYLLLLNSDVKLEENYFEHLLPHFSDGEVFGVMGRIIGWQDDNIQDGAKYPYFQSAKIKTSWNYLLQDEAAMSPGIYTMYLSGANSLFDRKKLLQLGGFNESFSPFYVEDYELSLRAWRLGWTCIYQHRAICRHKTSSSINSKEKKYFIRTISLRNKWLLHSIHLSGAERLAWALQAVGESLLQLLTGKTHYWKAFRLFRQKRESIRVARQELKTLAGTKPLLSVRAVARKILGALEGKAFHRFK